MFKLIRKYFILYGIIIIFPNNNFVGRYTFKQSIKNHW